MKVYFSHAHTHPLSRLCVFALCLILEACQPVPVQVSAIPNSPPEATLSQETLDSQDESVPLSDQGEALLPSSKEDLRGLTNLTRYAIQVQIDPANAVFQGHERVIYTNTLTIPLKQVYFRLLPNGHKSYGTGSLSVSKAAVNGKAVEPLLSVQDSALEIGLPGSLEPGSSLQIDLDFTGQVPVDYGWPGAYGIFDKTEGVLTLSGWYPILAIYDQHGWRLDPVSAIGDSVFSDMAFYAVQVTLPEDQVLASTGIVTQRQDAADLVRYHIVSGPARDFFIAVSSDFKIASETIHGTRVNSYYLPGAKTNAEIALDTAVKSLQIYTDKFGGYPYQELDILQAPLQNALGVEYPEIVMIGTALYQENPPTDSFAVTVAHEVAHQWWYNVVGDDVFNDPWLDEALATYSSSLFLEYTYGPSAASQLSNYWQQHYDKAVAEGKNDLVTRSVPYYESLNDPSIYSMIVYSKGALFFQAVRQEIGDQAFFSALQQYYASKKYQVAAPPDLLGAFEKASGRNLGDLYGSWLYTP